MPLYSSVTFIEECHPMLDCKLICRLQHTFYCTSKRAISHERLFPMGTNVFYCLRITLPTTAKEEVDGKAWKEHMYKIKQSSNAGRLEENSLNLGFTIASRSD